MSRVELNTAAPDFTLTDFKGNEVHLSVFRGNKNVLLVFNRGFFWPFCHRHMAQLRQEYDTFLEQGTEIVVVGPEDANAFAKYWQEHQLPFIGLPDPTHSVLKKYGQEVNLFKFGRQPAQVTIDKTGMVRFVHYGHDPSDIPTNEEILGVLKMMNAELLEIN